MRFQGLEIDLADIRTIVEHQGELITSQGAIIKDQHAQLTRLREEEEARAKAIEEMQREHEERGRQHSSWRRLAENIWEVARMLPGNGKGTETVSHFLHHLSVSHFATKAGSCVGSAESAHHPDSVAPDAPVSLALPITVAAPVSTADSIVPVIPIAPVAPAVKMPIVVDPAGPSSPLTTLDGEDEVSDHENAESAPQDDVKPGSGSSTPEPKKRRAQRKKAATGEASRRSTRVGSRLPYQGIDNGTVRLSATRKGKANDIELVRSKKR